MNTPREGSINAQVRNYLLSGRALTPVEAMTNFGTMRLAPRVDDLRKKYNMEIITTIKANPITGKKYASYSLLPQIDMRDRVRVKSIEASTKHFLTDAGEPLFAVGDIGRVISTSSRPVLVQFRNDSSASGQQWYVRREDLEILSKGN